MPRIPSLTAFVFLWSLLASAGVVSAQSFVEYQQLFEGGGRASPTVDGQLEIARRTLNPYGWFLATADWGEALFGVSKNVRPWLWASVAAGIETDDTPWRSGATVVVAKDRFFSLWVNEFGGSGHWYKFVASARILKRTSIGILSQAFYGTGPMVQFSLGRGFALWASVVEGPDTLVGIRRGF